MVSLFGSPAQDLDKFRSTVRSLGTSSVPGLAAALGWRERKVERHLAHELARPGTPIVYDPARRVVRWAAPGPAAPARTGAPAAPAPAAPRRPAPSPIAPAAPAPVLVGSALKVVCPSCHVALVSTGTGELSVCPECGRLARGPGRATPAAREAPTAAPAAPVPSIKTDGASPLRLVDRRAQELFAAYVTSQPIPCPKCGVPLKHRGVSQYSCPQCGGLVRFPNASELGGPTAPAAPPAPTP